jgi:ubiquinone/menaquinone biosynthesis C-methylase UbiE
MPLHILERIQRAKHFWLGPSKRQLAEAKAALGGREYYQLYDDLYREVSSAGGSAERERVLEEARVLVHGDFERVRSAGLLPNPPAALIDLGCGEGYNAMHFARLGYRVSGVDISPTIIASAAQEAKNQSLDIDFRVGDVLELADFGDGSFDIAVDTGCLHMLVRTEHRRRYLATVGRILKAGGVFFLFQRVALADVAIVDEEQEILKSVTLVQKRFSGNQGSAVKLRGCGFRNASLRQYRQELTEAGFEVLADYHDGRAHKPFAMVLARKG